MPEQGCPGYDVLKKVRGDVFRGKEGLPLPQSLEGRRSRWEDWSLFVKATLSREAGRA